MTSPKTTVGSSRNVRDPIAVALRLALEEALETKRRRDSEALERRRTIRLVVVRRDAA